MPATSSPSAGRPDTVAAMPGRFSISVPERRGPSDPWFRIGTLDVTTTVFVVILVRGQHVHLGARGSPAPRVL